MKADLLQFSFSDKAKAHLNPLRKDYRNRFIEQQKTAIAWLVVEALEPLPDDHDLTGKGIFHLCRLGVIRYVVQVSFARPAIRENNQTHYTLHFWTWRELEAFLKLNDGAASGGIVSLDEEDLLNGGN